MKARHAAWVIGLLATAGIGQAAATPIEIRVAGTAQVGNDTGGELAAAGVHSGSPFVATIGYDTADAPWHQAADNSFAQYRMDFAITVGAFRLESTVNGGGLVVNNDRTFVQPDTDAVVADPAGVPTLAGAPWRWTNLTLWWADTVHDTLKGLAPPDAATANRLWENRTDAFGRIDTGDFTPNGYEWDVFLTLETVSARELAARVPEPAPLALLGLALAGLGLRRSRAEKPAGR